MLKGRKSKDTIEKIAAVSRFLDIILRTDSKIRFSIVERGSKIKLRVIPGRQHFPESLLGSSVKQLGDKLRQVRGVLCKVSKRETKDGNSGRCRKRS